MRMLKKFIILVIMFSIIGIAFFYSADFVSANVGSVKGHVYMMYNGKKIYLPGVGVYRVDSNWDYRDYDAPITCNQWVSKAQQTTYEWNLYKYLCANETPTEGCENVPSCAAKFKYVSPPKKSCKNDCLNILAAGGVCTALDDVPASEPSPPTAAEIANQQQDICRADRGGVQVIADSNGRWFMGPGVRYDPVTGARIFTEFNNPGPLLPLEPAGPGRDLWGSLLCPTGTQDNVSYKGNDESKLNRCGFNCLENPHGLRAFFPDGYDFIEKNYPGIKWEDDHKGGGKWSTRFDNGTYDFYTHSGDIINFTYKESHGVKAWDDYAIDEWYKVIVGNGDNYSGFDFEWIPTNINQPPEFKDIDPKTNTPHLGTSTDTDNGPACTDNNPFTFSTTVSDPDGSKDVDRIEFSMARFTQLKDGAQRNWPLRVMFAQDFDGLSNNTFYIRDMETRSSELCLDKDGKTAPRDKSTIWCYATDSHSFNNGTLVNTTYKGVQVEKYYLNRDLTVDGDGYNAKLVAGQNNTFVAFQKGGNRVWASFRIEFLGGQNSIWTDAYANLWRVSDLVNNEDKTANLYPDEKIVYAGFGNHHQLKTTSLDFKPPKVSFGTVTKGADDKLRVPWYAEDYPTDWRRAGLLEVFGEAKDAKSPPDITPITSETAVGEAGVPASPPGYRPWVGGDYAANVFTSPFIFHPTGVIGGANRYPISGSRNEIINPLANSDLEIQFFAEAVDNACNMSSGSLPTNPFISASPWLMTRAGLLYSAGILNLGPRASGSNAPFCGATCAAFNSYPFSTIPQNQAALSSELLSVGDVLKLPDNMLNSTSAKTYAVPSYSDENNTLNGGDWYGALFNKVYENSDSGRFYYVQNKPLGNQPGGVNNLNFCADDKPCVVTTNAVNITANEFVCNREAFILVNGSMTVSKRIRIDDTTSKSNGCIFIVKGDVTINPIGSGGPDTEPNYDRLYAFILANGLIDIPASPDDYGLQVWGSLLAFGKSGNSFTLERSLEGDENSDYPAYVIHHDPRYFEIARKVVFDDEEAYKVEIGDKN